MATAQDPMTAAFLEGQRLKRLAIKSLNDLDLYQQAAELFHEAGKLTVGHEQAQEMVGPLEKAPAPRQVGNH